MNRIYSVTVQVQASVPSRHVMLSAQCAYARVCSYPAQIAAYSSLSQCKCNSQSHTHTQYDSLCGQKAIMRINKANICNETTACAARSAVCGDAYLGASHPALLLPLHEGTDWQPQSPLPVTLQMHPAAQRLS